MLGLINDILDLSKIESGMMRFERTTFSLDANLRHLGDLSTLKARERGLELLFDLATDIPDRLIGDPLRLSQVLINLIRNAADAMGHELARQGAGTIRIAAARSGERFVRMDVEDNGPGLNGPYATLLELSSLPYADWVKECRASYAGSTVSEVMFSGVSLALRWVQMFCEGKRVNLTAIAMEGCEVGGDTDTRLAIALPLCANICEVPKAVEGWDFITAYDTVLTTYFTRFCASEQ